MSLIHWAVVILIVLLVFGPKKLGAVGKGLGEGIRSFKQGISGEGGERADEESEPKRLPARRNRTS